MVKHQRKTWVFAGSEAHGKAQVGPKKAPVGPKMAQVRARNGQDGRRPAIGEGKMAQDTENGLEDAAQDRQDAVSERLSRAKVNKTSESRVR